MVQLVLQFAQANPGMARVMAGDALVHENARLQLRIGKQIEVLIDEVEEQGSVGRSFFDAPEIDGKVFVNDVGERVELREGEFHRCQITEAHDYDLVARLV